MATITVNGVDAKIEWQGHRKSRANNDGPRVAMRYQVPFLDGDLFADSLMGGVIVSGGVPTYVPRHQCPTNPKLYVLDVELDYAGERADGAAAHGAAPGSLGSPAFDTVLVTAVYGNLTWPQAFADDPGGVQSFPLESQPNQPILNAECEVDHGGNLITLPTGSLVFLSDGKKLDAPVSKWEGIDVWRVVRHNFPNLPYKTVRRLKNRVNNTPFLGQDRGCVRFANARSTGTMTAQGFKCQRFEIIFEIKDQDWNEFIRPDDLTYDTVAGAIDNSKFIYKYDDLTGLLA